MSYRHDVFISYCRDPQYWTAWTRDHFKHLMEIYLKQELGGKPDVFVDERIEEGADWPHELGEHLASSRIMVAVFSRDYFASQWCLHELDLMLGRSITTGSDSRLIIPVAVHGPDHIPDELWRKQAARFEEFRVAYIQRESQLYLRFSLAMKALVPKISRAIVSAPPYMEDWQAQARTRFDEVFKNDMAGKSLLVSNFQPKPLPMVKTVPRL